MLGSWYVVIKIRRPCRRWRHVFLASVLREVGKDVRCLRCLSFRNIMPLAITDRMDLKRASSSHLPSHAALSRPSRAVFHPIPSTRVPQSLPPIPAPHNPSIIPPHHPLLTLLSAPPPLFLQAPTLPTNPSHHLRPVSPLPSPASSPPFNNAFLYDNMQRRLYPAPATAAATTLVYPEQGRSVGTEALAYEAYLRL